MIMRLRLHFLSVQLANNKRELHVLFPCSFFLPTSFSQSFRIPQSFLECLWMPFPLSHTCQIIYLAHFFLLLCSASHSPLSALVWSGCFLSAKRNSTGDSPPLFWNSQVLAGLVSLTGAFIFFSPLPQLPHPSFFLK